MHYLAHTILYGLLALLATCVIIWRYNVLYSTDFLSLLSPQETYLIPRFSLDDTRKNDNKLPVKVFVWMQIVLSTGSWFVAFVPNTGACFAAFVPKYWSLACRLCAKLPVLGLLLSIVVACPNYRWLCFRCMLMYRAVAWLPLQVKCHHVIGCVAWFINWRLYELWCTSTI